MKSLPAAAICLVMVAPGAACAQDAAAPTLPEVTVTTPRGDVPLFDVAGSADRVDGDDMRNGRLQVNLSESLGPVPGLQVQNRQNYAQDLQISIRGFGARSTFGLRGVRLYVDGIPATLPDGQGQTSNIDISSADRVEVLRGPFSALYGNSSGGVLQVYTARGEGAPKLSYSLAGGSYGTLRQSVEASGSSGGIDYLLSGSNFHTDGYRDHSEARRSIENGKLGVQLGDDSRLTFVLNSVQIRAQDPLGLTADQAAANPRGAALATQYDTRKTVDQTQAGVLYEKRVNADNDLRLMVYGGERKERACTNTRRSRRRLQAQSTQQSGGVIDLSPQLQRAGRALDRTHADRRRAAGDRHRARLRHTAGASAGATRTTSAASMRRCLACRAGCGATRTSTMSTSSIPTMQATWHLSDRWTFELGARHSSVHFNSEDHYIVRGNGDDSGAASYNQSLPVTALRYAVTKDLNVYVTAGRGFETPTLNELAYRPDGQGGLNFALQPAINRAWRSVPRHGLAAAC